MRMSIITGVLLATALKDGFAAGPCKAGLNEMTGETHLAGRSPLAVLLRFAYDNHVCIGIENPGGELLKTPVRVDIQSPRVIDLIHNVLNPSRYSIYEREGVVLIQNIDRGYPNAQLDVVVPEYKLARTSVAWANFAVFTRLLLLADPSLQGIAGNVMDRAPGNQVGPFDEHGRLVRDLLTLIVGRSSDGGAWISGPCGEAARGDKGPCWTVLQYQDDTQTIDSHINDVVERIHREQAPSKPLAVYVNGLEASSGRP